jgi:putative ATP-dependent endonuclease of the OLD family
MNAITPWEDFRRFGCHLVVCDGKSAIVQPLAIAKEMGIPVFTICDSDKHDCGNEGKRQSHERDNKAILRLCALDDSNPFPDETLWSQDLVMWTNEIEKTLVEDVGHEKWLLLRQRVRTEHEITDVGDLDKNATFIGLLLAQAWEDGTKFPSLERLCKSILEFAASHHSILMVLQKLSEENAGSSATVKTLQVAADQSPP